MNAPETIRAAEPINPAHEVLVKALDAMCAQQIAAEIHSRPRPTKPQMKAVDKWLKELHACGMLTSQPGRGGVALYSLITPVCDLVQTEGKSQTAAFAERILTPEAEAEREDFEAMYGMLGNCSCHISPPCGSCVHPGNPRNQEEDETAWMAAGDSEGGETDAPAAINDTPKFGHGLSCGACHDGCAGEQCKVERDSPPIDAQREEFTLLGLIADIRAAAGDPDGRLMQDELVQHIAGVVKERDDLRARIHAQIEQWQTDTGALAKKAHRLAADLKDMTRDRDLLKAENLALKTLDGSMPGFGAEHQEQRINSLTTDVINTRNALTNAINEADRLRAELATERQAREALQEQSGVIQVAGYIVRAAKRKPRTILDQDKARDAALSAIRAGAQRAEVFAIVPIGAARRGAEWRDA